MSHHWVEFKRFKWAVCLWCGLIALKNDATARLIRRRCPGADD